MSYRERIYYSALACAWGGFISWLIYIAVKNPVTSPYYQAIIRGGLAGLFIGITYGALNGTTDRLTIKTIKSAQQSLVVCFLGGLISLLAGEFLYQKLLDFPLFRVPGWVLFGLFIGISGGFFEGSKQRIISGIIGGLVGGFAGGIVYEFLRLIIPNRAWAVESIGIALFAALVGAIVGIFHLMMRKNWLTVVSGKLIGAQYPVEKRITRIGNHYDNDIVIKSQTVSDNHAEIRKMQDRYILVDLHSDKGTVVNGRKIDENMIKGNFRIKIGDDVEFQFEQRVSKSAGMNVP